MTMPKDYDREKQERDFFRKVGSVYNTRTGKWEVRIPEEFTQAMNDKARAMEKEQASQVRQTRKQMKKSSGRPYEMNEFRSFILSIAGCVVLTMCFVAIGGWVYDLGRFNLTSLLLLIATCFSSCLGYCLWIKKHNDRWNRWQNSPTKYRDNEVE